MEDTNPACLGKTLLVSGGSRGLGLLLVDSYLRRGARVATFARGMTEAVEELIATNAERFRFRAIDALDTPAVDRFVGDVWAEFGRIDGLVNNAAIGQDNLIAHLDPALVGQIIDINLRAPILLTRAVVRRMMLQEGGRIVNVSSICASRGFAGLSVYSATKGGLDAFTRALARELGPRGILVNAIAPGFFASEMSATLGADQLDSIRRRTPTGRLLEERELLTVFDLLLFRPTCITGQVIVVDGGAGL